MGADTTILTAYGQFQETSGGLHFHEGLDIIAPPLTLINAIENGTYWNGARNFNWTDFVAGVTGTHGWNYVHATPAQGLQSGSPLNLVIATVADHPTLPDHLHLDYTSANADPTYATLLRPIGNALDYLSSHDTVSPTAVVGGARFRTAASDFNGPILPPQSGDVGQREDLARNHHYFQTYTALGVTIPYVGARGSTQDADGNAGTGSVNIDVISNVYDQQIAAGRRLAPYSVSFRIKGGPQPFPLPLDDTGWVTPFKFTGEFLNPQSPVTGHNYGALRDLNLLRTVYEHDVQAQSTEGEDSFFTLTNYNGNATVEFSATDLVNDDRSRSWQSNVRRNHPTKFWYSALDDSDRSTYNAGAAFQDGFYNLYVKATDASNNESAVADTRFLLSNYTRTFSGVMISGSTPLTVRVDTFANYMPTDYVPIYATTTIPTEGATLTNQIGQIYTNQTGSIDQPVDLPYSLWLVADYDHDGKYHSPLDVVLTVRTEEQLLAAASGDSATVRTLMGQQVDALLPEAIRRWQAAGADPSALADVDIRIADLGGRTLGLASGTMITLDDNAAGWGWYVDASPQDDAEFLMPGNQGQQNRMDLLTVLSHEIGHVLGHEHDEHGVMMETLSAGTRRMPSDGIGTAARLDGREFFLALVDADALTIRNNWHSTAVHSRLLRSTAVPGVDAGDIEFLHRSATLLTAVPPSFPVSPSQTANGVVGPIALGGLNDILVGGAGTEIQIGIDGRDILVGGSGGARAAY